MATVGTLPEFDTSNPSSWDVYAEQVKYFLEANSVTEPAKQRATLIAVCGIKTLSILRSLIAPDNLSDKTYDQLTQILKNHFSPKASVIYRRFLFHKRFQLQNETVTEYVTELRRLAEDCNFGNTLSERLRDQLVCGLRDEAVQRRLLAESELTFDDGVKKALAAETAAEQSKNIHSQGTVRGNNFVDKVQVKFGTPGKQNFKHKGKGTQNSCEKTCYGCGGNHERSQCKFKNALCRFCKRVGHIEKVCHAKLSQKGKHTPVTTSKSFHNVKLTSEVIDSNYCMNAVNKYAEIPYKQSISVYLENVKCDMEIDSGSFYSIISYDTFKKLWPTTQPVIQSSDIMLSDFQRNKIPLHGMCMVNVKHKEHSVKLNLLITKRKCTSILGYDWFRPLGIQISGINSISHDTIENVLKEFKEVFEEGLGFYTGPPISLPVDQNFPPIRFKARSVPLALRPKIDEAIDKLLYEGVIEPISNPTWSTPVVPVIKPSGEVRLCGDYKVTLNKAMRAHPYPIPSVTHLLSNMKGGGYYAKIDLAQAYLQLKVDDTSAEAQTIITHRGAFKVNRLQYGVNVAPGIFQNLIEDLISNIEGVVPYFDDILLRATSLEELAARLREVLKRLKEAGLRAKKNKCHFGVNEVDFLGYRIDASGIHPSKSKVDAIKNAPTPLDKRELQAFLGLLNFYSCFLKDKATVAEPLHRLLQKNVPWTWTKTHDTAFNSVKNLLSSDKVLMPFDEKLPIILTCDASPYGVGSVLSHLCSNGREVPIAFASRTLTSAERNYAQIDKEALSIIAGVKKFHHFLYGHKFTIVTDHKPILGLFATSKPTPSIISPRMLRWCLILNAYDYEIVHRPGKRIEHADALSRLPIKIQDSEVPPPLEVLFTEQLEAPPLLASEIARMTVRDPILSRVLNWVLRGWPDSNPSEEFRTFFLKRNELSVHKQCLLWGNRVVIPKAGQLRVLDELHLSHPGVEHMKALARSYVWWPGIDADITKCVENCKTCQETRHAPPRAPIHPWEVTSAPWSRLHIDFAGPFQGHNFLIVVDSFSKWLEVRLMKETTAAATVDTLREIFSTHGIPDTIVSDNGPQFTSAEYTSFLDSNTIRKVLISAYRPAGNGQAERMVQTTKENLKRLTCGNWKQRLARFLLHQHITPSSTTGISPAELLMGRRLKTILDRLHPDFVAKQKITQETYIDKEFEKHRYRSFDVNDPVYIQNFRKGEKWVPAKVLEPTGPVSYRTVTPTGDIARRHIDQMRKRQESPKPPLQKNEPDSVYPKSPDRPEVPVTVPKSSTPGKNCVPSPDIPDVSGSSTPIATPVRPKRNIVRPKRFEDFVT